MQKRLGAGRVVLSAVLAFSCAQGLVATQGVSVSGTVVPDPPRANVPTDVVLLSGNTTLRARVTREQTFVFTRIPPGTYDAYIDDVGMSQATLLGTGMPATRLVIGQNGATGIRLEAPRRIVVQGNTTIEADVPVPSFSVSFANTRPGARPVTDVVGYAGSVYTPLYAGEYRVTVVGLPAGFVVRSLAAGKIDLRTQPLAVNAGSSPTIAVGLAIDPSTRSPFISISGRLTGGDSSKYGQTRLSLYSRVLSVPLASVVAADGTFSIPRALPGTYAVRYIGNRPVSGDPAISLGVGATDLTGVELPFTSWRQISGRVVVPGGAALPRYLVFSATFPNGAALSADGSAADIERKLGPGQIVVTPLGHLSVSAPVQPDGSFIVNLPVGERQFKLNGSSVPAGSALKSATYGNADLLKEPMRVVAAGAEELVITFVTRRVP